MNAIHQYTEDDIEEMAFAIYIHNSLTPSESLKAVEDFVKACYARRKALDATTAANGE